MTNPSSRRLATKKQVLYANAIAETVGYDLTFTEKDSYYEVNKFITENEEQYRNAGNEKIASVRQIDYANAISNACGLNIFFGSKSKYKETADFISRHKGEYIQKKWRESICEYDNAEKSIEIPTESMLFICDNLFGKHGLYAFIGKDNVVLYIGKSIDLSSRIPKSYRERKDYAKINKVMYYVDDNMANVNIMEILLIAEYNPILNTESKTEDIPTKFYSGIDILNDFKEIPKFCNNASERSVAVCQ
ncbi:MAG: hypothetical protein LUI12_01935 [Clostridiales bacterium]|nr:hypothetical protein [Clostridiales bacterium]